MWLKIRSRNYSANQLRKQIKVKKPTVFRLGSFTKNEDIFTEKQLKNGIIEINTVASCMKSNDKGLMKECFDEAKVPTAKWSYLKDFIENKVELQYPVIIKHKHSSKGWGIYYCPTKEDFVKTVYDKQLQINNYIIEEYKTYSREYRLHVDRFGCFLTHRKMLKENATDRWHRHHINTIWYVENNPQFDKPTNWNEIVSACQEAIKSVGLEIGCVDVKVQNSEHENPKFIILETNSAPALGEETAKIYLNELQKIYNYYEKELYRF